MDEKESFLKLTRTKGFLNDEQLRNCEAHWENLKAEGIEKKIWDVALDLGFLSAKAHRRIDEHMTFITLRELDKTLGATAVERGMVKAGDVEVALMLQRKTHKDEGRVRCLEDILLDMDALKGEDLEAFRNLLEEEVETLPTDGDDSPPEIEPLAPLEMPGLDDLETHVGDEEEPEEIQAPPPTEKPGSTEPAPSEGAGEPPADSPPEEPGEAEADIGELTLDLDGLDAPPPPEPEGDDREEGEAPGEPDRTEPADEETSTDESSKGAGPPDEAGDEDYPEASSSAGDDALGPPPSDDVTWA